MACSLSGWYGIIYLIFDMQLGNIQRKKVKVSITVTRSRTDAEEKWTEPAGKCTHTQAFHAIDHHMPKENALFNE